MADRTDNKVALRLITDNGVELITAILVRTVNGKCWAYPDDAPTDAAPETAGAIELDPSLLEEAPQLPNEPRVYLYRGTVDARQEEVLTPPSLLHFLQSRKPTTLH